MNETDRDWSRLRSTLALLAGVTVSLAIFPGYPRSAAVIQIGFGTALAALAVGLHKWPRLSRSAKDLNRIAITVAIPAGLVLFLVQIFALVGPSTVNGWMWWSLVGVVLAASTTAVLLTGGRKSWIFAIFLLSYAVALLNVIHTVTVSIDVALFQVEAAKALLGANNPYTVVYPDIYTASPGLFYGEGVSIDGILQFGFPYSPLSLLAVAPFQWLLDDFRFAQALAVIGTGWLISRLSSDPTSRLAAIAFLLFSPAATVAVYGWTEPLLALATVLVMFTYQRRSALAPYAMGALVALKQYAFILLPGYLLLLDHPIRIRDVIRSAVRIGAVFVAVTLPFFLWNPEAFLRSAVFLQFRQPIRMDSLSVLTQSITIAGTPPLIVVTLVPFVAVLGAVVFGLRRAPLGPQGFALTNGLTMLVWPLFAKQAFMNYYFLAIALLFAAAAVLDPQHPARVEVLDT